MLGPKKKIVDSKIVLLKILGEKDTSIKHGSKIYIKKGFKFTKKIGFKQIFYSNKAHIDLTTTLSLIVKTQVLY